MISLPAGAIEVKFLDQKWSPEAKKLTFRVHSALFGIEFAEILFFDQWSAGRLELYKLRIWIKKEFWIKKTFFNQPDESDSPIYRS